MTFTQWLKHNTYRADPIGDLARDVARDSEWPKSDYYKTYREYIKPHGCDGALRALRKAWNEYELYVGGRSQLNPKVWVWGVTGDGGLKEAVKKAPE